MLGPPVSRYDADGLADVLTTAVTGATTVAVRSESHTTPAGATQPFIWVAGVVGAS